MGATIPRKNAILPREGEKGYCVVPGKGGEGVRKLIESGSKHTVGSKGLALEIRGWRERETREG